jgi:predicted flap endonuclease-1-like 5' DNA nuclease
LTIPASAGTLSYGMMTGGVGMKRIVGALMVFSAALLYRGDDLWHSWKPVSPVASVPVAEPGAIPGAAAGPVAEPGGEPDGAARPGAEPVDKAAAKSKAAPPRKEVPLDYKRNPLIFLSSAPKDSLVLLPGVGPVIADRIINARTGKRSFTKWEDLLAVKGIGPKTLERMKRLAGAANP